jgi:ethanolamine-phosphate phospho-lyase
MDKEDNIISDKVVMSLSIESMMEYVDDDKEEIIKERNKLFPKCIYHSFKKPLLINSARDQYYNNDILDLYNNVCHIGHSNEKVLETIKREYETVNINTRYLNKNLQEYAISLFKYLSHLPCKYKVIFVNSGSEANDLALRISLMYRKSIEYPNFISLKNSYHGTTYLCDKVSNLYSTGLVKDSFNSNNDVKFIEPNNIEELDKLFSEKDCTFVSSIIIETIQGVGGNIPLDKEYVKKLFDYADNNKIIKICDEVQTGFGRTGHSFWSFDYYNDNNKNIIPDIITCGKPIANGYPMGAVIVKSELAELLGNFYFNTFGGNSVACAVARTVIEEIEEKSLVENSKIIGNYLINKLEEIDKVINITGRGLYIAFNLYDKNEEEIVEKLKDNKIIVGLGRGNRIRIKPPMIVTKENIDHFINILKSII